MTRFLNKNYRSYLKGNPSVMPKDISESFNREQGTYLLKFMHHERLEGEEGNIQISDALVGKATLETFIYTY